MKWILLALFSQHIQAALPVVSPQAISFYKTPKSLFASGQVSRSDLEKNLIRTEKELSYQVEWDKKNYTIKSPDLLRESQTLHRAFNTEILIVRSLPQSNGLPTTTLMLNSDVEVLRIQDNWALIKNKSSQQGWVLLSALEAKPEDFGVAYVFMDTFLREKPEGGAKLITTIAQGTRLSDFEIKNNWLYVKTENQKGYIDLGHVYLRADFAKWAHHKSLGWVQIKHREESQLRTQDNLLFPITDFNSFVSHPHRAFVINAQNEGPQKRSRVEIKQFLADRWAVSRIKDHGEVWWKTESLSINNTVSNENIERISTTDLLKRDVFSMAFTDAKKLQGLVSAKGIYKTDDGQIWSKISSFGNSDYPVAVHSDGVWFVGPYRSLDAGKSFEPFIRWDKIADILAQKNIHMGAQFKILKLESLKTPYIEMLLDIGTRRVKLETHILNQTWRTVK